MSPERQVFKKCYEDADTAPYGRLQSITANWGYKYELTVEVTVGDGKDVRHTVGIPVPIGRLVNEAVRAREWARWVSYLTAKLGEKKALEIERELIVAESLEGPSDTERGETV